MDNVLKILFHLLPLIGIYFQRVYLTIALCLLVILAYIKYQKLTNQLSLIDKENDEKHFEQISISLNRIKYFIFR